MRRNIIIALVMGVLIGGSDGWWVAPMFYFLGVAAIIVSGIMLKKTKAFAGEPTPFVMELPDYHFPSLKSWWLHIWERVSAYIKKAGTIIFAASVVVWFLSNFGFTDAGFGFLVDGNVEQSLLKAIADCISWIFVPLGADNWMSAAASINALVAKENLVSTFGVLFGLGDATENSLSMWGGFASMFTDASGIIWSQRIIKSADEIECHRRACQATGYAHDKTFYSIEAGMTEREISMLAQQCMLEGGAEYPGFVIITSGEGNYERISAISSDRRIQKGDLLWLDLGAVYNGYWSDFCRAGVVGPISDERNKMQDDIYDATDEAASIMRPGTPIRDVAYACGKALEKRGYSATYDCGRMGHGMGLMSTEPPSVTVRDEGILKPGMIINLEPGILVDSGVFCIEENYVITEDGYERLSTGSRKLHQIRG